MGEKKEQTADSKSSGIQILIILFFGEGCTETTHDKTQGRTHQRSLQLPHLTPETPGDAAQLDADDHSQADRNSGRQGSTTIEQTSCHAP